MDFSKEKVYCNPPWNLAEQFIKKFEATKVSNKEFKAIIIIPDKKESWFEEFV